ncbi:hypothetical protein [Effusibacillus dendaii]|uniref:Uncharacterized protein n=1 Tax=Effusibacillus dendaii TaxID=2743772 RepID=A0A7I8DI01_9BACL|nr:hypothetical protein [Effusibacillus dendaii]BCJ88270.1 hypothetical protein skT53_32550 [Effusibacillus dendaii]
MGDKQTIVVIGGVVAGASAAAKARREDEQAAIHTKKGTMYPLQTVACLITWVMKSPKN